MLCGFNTLGPGGYAGTPIADRAKKLLDGYLNGASPRWQGPEDDLLDVLDMLEPKRGLTGIKGPTPSQQ